MPQKPKDSKSLKLRETSAAPKEEDQLKFSGLFSDASILNRPPIHSSMVNGEPVFHPMQPENKGCCCYIF